MKTKARKSRALKCSHFGEDHEGYFRGRGVRGGGQGVCVCQREGSKGGVRVKCVRGRGGRVGIQVKFIRGRRGNGRGKNSCCIIKGGKHPRFIRGGNYGVS